MVKVGLRTKFLLSLLVVSSGLTCATLLIVRDNVKKQVRNEIINDLRNSVLTFQNVQRQRETTLTRSAELLANLPNVRALMTTRDEATIQDASKDPWRLSGGDVFVLADRTGKVAALHTTTPGLARSEVEEMLRHSAAEDSAGHWWYGSGHLYEVFLQPIYFGTPSDNSMLGVLAVGYEVDDRVAREVSRVTATQAAFRYGGNIVASTLSATQNAELVRVAPVPSAEPGEIKLGGEEFLATSVNLTPAGSSLVALTVLNSFDKATSFLNNLNQLLLGVGLLAVLAGSALVYVISLTFTRPLEGLVAGVRALEKGDYEFPLVIRSRDEVAEVTSAFRRMRLSLRDTQKQLLDSERLATIGRMAASISHDLRHPLAAVVANAEFLCETGMSNQEREELYQEIRTAVNEMTDLIDSLLEFSRNRENLRPVYGSVAESVRHAIESVRIHPQFDSIRIKVQSQGSNECWFDPKRLERALYNLLLNACEAVSKETGVVEVTIQRQPEMIEILVTDNGPGIPEPVREKLFQPFISYGKENGTGLGLTIVHKIVQDHGGTLVLENTSSLGTTFRVVLPVLFSRDEADAKPAAGVPLTPVRPRE